MAGSCKVEMSKNVYSTPGVGQYQAMPSSTTRLASSAWGKALGQRADAQLTAVPYKIVILRILGPSHTCCHAWVAVGGRMPIPSELVKGGVKPDMQYIAPHAPAYRLRNTCAERGEDMQAGTQNPRDPKGTPCTCMIPS